MSNLTKMENIIKKYELQDIVSQGGRYGICDSCKLPFGERRPQLPPTEVSCRNICCPCFNREGK